MSTTTILGVTPGRLPVDLLVLRNGHGWSPSIWGRLLAANGRPTEWLFDESHLLALWRSVEELPEWQQAPMVLTFDTGVIPWQEYGWAAEMLDEFERRSPALPGHVNHVPAVADLLRTGPEVPFVGVHGTSVSQNTFTRWVCERAPDDPDLDLDDGHYVGIDLAEMYVLRRHRQWISSASSRTGAGSGR